MLRSDKKVAKGTGITLEAQQKDAEIFANQQDGEIIFFYELRLDRL